MAVRCDDHAPLLSESRRKCVQQTPDTTEYEMGGDVLNATDRPYGVFYLETEGTDYDIHPVPVMNFTYGRREHEAERERQSTWRQLISSAATFLPGIL